MDAVVAFIANREATKPSSQASVRTATGLRKQRLETHPQRIVQEGLCHSRPYQVDPQVQEISRRF